MFNSTNATNARYCISTAEDNVKDASAKLQTKRISMFLLRPKDPTHAFKKAVEREDYIARQKEICIETDS